MPIYYSQTCIHKTQRKIKKYIKKIENHYLRDQLKYKYIKKLYYILKTKKSMISSNKLQEDIISFIRVNKEIHKRFIVNYRHSNSSLIQIITEISERIIMYNSESTSESSDSDSSVRRGNNTSESEEESCNSEDSSEY